MPSVSTTMLLAAIVLLTLAALAGALLEAALRRLQLRRLARQAGWEYQRAGDPEILQALLRRPPAPGAADVRVSDVLQHTGAAKFSIACVDYTLGAIRQRRDSTQIVAVVHGFDGALISVQPAPADLPRIDQYRHLMNLLATSS